MFKTFLAATIVAAMGLATAARAQSIPEEHGAYVHHHHHAAHFYHMTHRHHHHGDHRSTATGGNPGGYADRN